jgi:uridine kinase
VSKRFEQPQKVEHGASSSAMQARERPSIRPLLVGIAGGSGSGKSSLARAIAGALGPTQVALLSHDAYYRDRGGLPAPARAAVHDDLPDAFDQALFLEHLAALRAGRAVRPPTYCFITHRRTGEGATVLPRPIVVVEGVLLLWDPSVRAALDLKIYLDAPERVRLERRVARDVSERGRSTDDALTQFAVTVREAHRTYVEPTRAMADLVLSTAGRIEPIAEIALAVVLDRFGRRQGERARKAS